MTPEIETLKSEIAELSARISMVEVQIAAMDDDIPEPDLRNAESGISGLWSGRVISHDGRLIREWDFNGDPPDAVENTHIHIDLIAGTADWGNGENDGMLSYEVAKSDGDGGYVLCDKTCGDIVLPVPEKWGERQILHSDKDSKLIVADLGIKTDNPSVGFTFEKPKNVDDLVQMKATGGSSGNVLVRGGGGAAYWDYLPIEFDTIVGGGGESFSLELTPAAEGNPPLLTLGVPMYGKIEYVTGITPELRISGGSIFLRLIIHRKEFDMDLIEINDLDDIYSDEATLPCAYCPG